MREKKILSSGFVIFYFIQPLLYFHFVLVESPENWRRLLQYKYSPSFRSFAAPSVILYFSSMAPKFLQAFYRLTCLSQIDLLSILKASIHMHLAAFLCILAFYLLRGLMRKQLQWCCSQLVCWPLHCTENAAAPNICTVALGAFILFVTFCSCLSSF